MNPLIVSAQWLNEHLNDSNLIVLDASQPVNVEERIPGARKFDIKNDFSDTSSDFPNTFPSKEQIESGCRALGINSDSHLVVYDSRGVFSSPRVWWMFNTMGHQKVSVLDGGLPEWKAQGFETEKPVAASYASGNFTAKLNASVVKDYQFMCSNLEHQNHLVLDARSKGRFDGTAPEPREGLPSGSMPNSVSLPYTEVLSDGKFKSVEELKEVFSQVVTDDRPLTFSCGSGITACIILLASEMALEREKSVYDGSWTEWAQLDQRIVTV